MTDRLGSGAFMPYPESPLPVREGGPLAGLSFAVKDFFDVSGYPTSAGQPFLLALSGIKTQSSSVVTSLLNAGADFVGKTVSDELGFSINGQNAHFGSPVNGAAPERMSGGSSSGSASAVSNHLCDFSIGSDTGGSVRIPASHCGLIGLRPSHGRISLDGAIEMAKSFDCCGWFARDIDCFSRVADVLIGQDAFALRTDLRLLVPEEVMNLLSAEVMQAVLPAMDKISAALGPAHRQSILKGLSLDDLLTAFRQMQGFEAWRTHGSFIDRFQPPLGPGVSERFAWSKTVTDEQYQASVKVCRSFRADLEALLRDDAILVMPTAPDIAPLKDTDAMTIDQYRSLAMKMLCISGLSGFPQISLPLASRLGAPLGLSLLGPKGSDRQLISLAAKILKAK